jgi:TonB-linked SusC/RagA family outer membrane protein
MWQPIVSLLSLVSLASPLLAAGQVMSASVDYMAASLQVAATEAREHTLTGLPPRLGVKEGTVRGRVTELGTGRPLAAARVQVSGTSLGALTDAEGRFQIHNVPAGNVDVQVHLLGYLNSSQTVTVESGATVNVDFRLDRHAIALDPVVVVGYGTAQKRDVTGAVSSLSVGALAESVGRTRVDEALVGRMPGVQVQFPDGEPGRSPTIRIRGLGSITAGAQPLFVVDGMPTDDIESLNMNDVQSVDVLKDASAAAIYGSRGANGVIMITTRRGREGGAAISYDTYVGWQQVSRIREMLNARQQAQYYFDGIRNANLDAGRDVSGDPTTWGIPVGMEVIDVLEGRNTRDVNPLDYVLRTAPMQQHTLSVRGSENNINYALSGQYLKQDGIIIESDFQRMSLRANFDAQLTDKLRVDLNLNPSYITRNRVDDSGHASEPTDLNIVGVATTMHNYFPVLASDGHPGGNANYDLEGDYFLHGGYGSMANLINPVAIAREINREVNQNRVFGNMNVAYTFRGGLTLRTMLGGNVHNTREAYWRPDLPRVFYAHSGSAQSSEARGWDQNWLMESILSYDNSFRNHNLSSIAGFTAQKNRSQSVNLGSDRFRNNLVQTLNAATEITNGSSSISEWALLSYLARVSYNYNSRYYLTASIRADGSSRFGADSRWGVFPSVGLSWRISDERFMRNLGILSDLRLRSSYGQAGNNNIGNYSHLATVVFEQYPSGSGYAPGSVANPNLRWEKQRQWNAALDASLFNGRLNLSSEYSNTVSSDLLLNVQVPRLTGFSSSLQNIGEVRNVGWEFSLGSVNVSTPAFSWSTDFNISSYRNRVLRLGPEGAPIISASHITAVGRPIGMFRGWIVDPDRPIFLSQGEVDEGPIWNPGSNVRSRPGDYRFLDINGDGIIDNDDRVEMGSPYPDFYYGLTNRFRYGNVSLSVVTNGIHGSQILAQSARSNFNTRGRMKSVTAAWNYWKSEDDIGNGRTPRPNHQPTGGNREQWISTLLQDGSYLRVSNINLSYTVPMRIAQRLGMEELRIYYNAINPFIVTDFNGFNPEVSHNSSNLEPGVDLNNYPIPKSHMIGATLSF